MAPHDEIAYQVIAARRLQWDNLVWQVPLISLTAQAFLFTTALGGDSTRPARVVTALLSLAITVLCMALMARHRQSEILDANLMAYHEATEWHISPTLHGKDFAQLRNAGPIDGGWTDALILRRPGKKTVGGYRAWIVGQAIFGVAAIWVLFMTAFFPKVLDRPADLPSAPIPITVAPAPITFAPTIVGPEPPAAAPGLGESSPLPKG